MSIHKARIKNEEDWPEWVFEECEAYRNKLRELSKNSILVETRMLSINTFCFYCDKAHSYKSYLRTPFNERNYTPIELLEIDEGLYDNAHSETNPEQV